MKDQHKKIKGYRDLTQDEISLMNKIKELGVEIGALCTSLTMTPIKGEAPDQRWVAIGKTDLQKGIMALVRSVAKPESF